MPPNGSFFTVMNTVDLEGGQGVVLSCGGGGGGGISEFVRFSEKGA